MDGSPPPPRKLDGGARGIEGSKGKTTFARVGWLDVGSTRIPASGKGVGGGVKRLTVCYHGNATPLRQEEAEFNPLQSHCDPSPPSTHSISTHRASCGGNDVRSTIPNSHGLRHWLSAPSCFQNIFISISTSFAKSKMVSISLLRLLPYFLNHRLNVNYWSIRDPPPDESYYRVCFRVSNFRISDMMRVVRKNAKKFLFDWL